MTGLTGMQVRSNELLTNAGAEARLGDWTYGDAGARLRDWTYVEDGSALIDIAH
ncbi:hypothetical protein [Paenibacillus silvae]|uniref:hypothetical protein n=1 Tax=Paenibacillus silvae TaxID=1325358 RepID=UPI002002B829|nr:hypothetical protein [Paenibacillus silvae]